MWVKMGLFQDRWRPQLGHQPNEPQMNDRHKIVMDTLTQTYCTLAYLSTDIFHTQDQNTNCLGRIKKSK